jgi:ADP-ribose pyrophosphatase
VEVLAKPGVGGIITKNMNGMDYILIQERCKAGGGSENGLIEIPAGKIREFESIFDCLRREIREETGLEVTEIEGENDTVIIKSNNYKVINYMPFACAQNLEGSYPIMVQTFICKVEGKALEKTNETKNIRWISLKELKEMLDSRENEFYPMHIIALRKYLQR